MLRRFSSGVTFGLQLPISHSLFFSAKRDIATTTSFTNSIESNMTKTLPVLDQMGALADDNASFHSLGYAARKAIKLSAWMTETVDKKSLAENTRFSDDLLEVSICWKNACRYVFYEKLSSEQQAAILHIHRLIGEAKAIKGIKHEKAFSENPQDHDVMIR